MEENLFTLGLLNSLFIALGHVCFLPILLAILRIRSGRVRRWAHGFAILHACAAVFLLSPFTFIRVQLFLGEAANASWLPILRELNTSVAGAWFVIAVYLLASRSWRAHRAHAAISSLSLLLPPPDSRLLADLRDLSRQFGIRNPRLLLVDLPCPSPFVVGALQPTIIFPAASLGLLDRGEIRAILAHEIAHVKRRDVFRNMILEGARLALFFNWPLALLISRFREEVEGARDMESCRMTSSSWPLASALRKLHEQCARSFPAASLTGYSTFMLQRQAHVERRIGGLLAFSRARRCWPGVLQALLLLLCFLPPGAAALGKNAVSVRREEDGRKELPRGTVALGFVPTAEWLVRLSRRGEDG
jgi:Zn-dependent protease with chaperone function